MPTASHSSRKHIFKKGVYFELLLTFWDVWKHLITSIITCSTHFKHYQLWNSSIYSFIIGLGQKQLITLGAADANEMYDWLPQQDIIQAIDWVLQHVQRKSRRSHVTVVYQESRLGKSLTLMPLCQYHSNRFLKCLGFNWKMHFFS